MCVFVGGTKTAKCTRVPDDVYGKNLYLYII